MMQSIPLDLDDVHGAEDGYLSDEEFPPLADELPPLSPTRNNTDPFGDEDNTLINGADLQGSDADKENQGDKKRPRRLVNRKPQPKLDAARLCSDRGLPTLSKHFEQVKFKGKGHEVGDLNRLMSTMEHWAHRLFPKMPFDEVIERIEKLGKKRPVQTCIKKIRLDMPLLDDEFVEQEDDPEGNVMNDGSGGDEDEMDAISQPAGPSSQTLGPAANSSVSLSEGQKERIEQNKRLALERRKSKGLATPAGTKGAITANEILDLERNHADEEDMENELWNDITMFEAAQRNIWKTSPKKAADEHHVGSVAGDRGYAVKARSENVTKAPSSAKGTTQTAVSDGNSREEVIDIDADISEEENDKLDGGKKDEEADTIGVDSEKEGEKIDNEVQQTVDIDADTSEEMKNLGGEKKKVVDTTEDDKVQEDSREVVAIDIDAEAPDKETETLGETKDAVVETIDVDSENEVENIEDAGREDREGNTSSELVLKWDSESADESVTVRELGKKPRTETAEGMDVTVSDREIPLGAQDAVKDSPDRISGGDISENVQDGVVSHSKSLEGVRENANTCMGSVEMETD